MAPRPLKPEDIDLFSGPEEKAVLGIGCATAIAGVVTLLSLGAARGWYLAQQDQAQRSEATVQDQRDWRVTYKGNTQFYTLGANPTRRDESRNISAIRLLVDKPSDDLIDNIDFKNIARVDIYSQQSEHPTHQIDVHQGRTSSWIDVTLDDVLEPGESLRLQPIDAEGNEIPFYATFSRTTPKQ
jgi:hypothetical protein